MQPLYSGRKYLKKYNIPLKIVKGKEKCFIFPKATPFSKVTLSFLIRTPLKIFFFFFRKLIKTITVFLALKFLNFFFPVMKNLFVGKKFFRRNGKSVRWFNRCNLVCFPQIKHQWKRKVFYFILLFICIPDEFFVERIYF